MSACTKDELILEQTKGNTTGNNYEKLNVPKTAVSGSSSSTLSVTDRVKAIIIENLGVQPNEVVDDARIVQDLGADELNIIEIIHDMEVEFDLDIPDEESEKLLTVKNYIDYVFHHLDTITITATAPKGGGGAGSNGPLPLVFGGGTGGTGTGGGTTTTNGGGGTSGGGCGESYIYNFGHSVSLDDLTADNTILVNDFNIRSRKVTWTFCDGTTYKLKSTEIMTQVKTGGIWLFAPLTHHKQYVEGNFYGGTVDIEDFSWHQTNFFTSVNAYVEWRTKLTVTVCGVPNTKYGKLDDSGKSWNSWGIPN